MQLRQNIVLRQELTMTPQQILRSELLQIPMMMLESRIKLELEDNPVLEMDEGEVDLSGMLETTDGGEEEEREEEQVDDDNNVDWDQYSDRDNLEFTPPSQKNSSTAEVTEIPRPTIQTLQEHLTSQLQVDRELGVRDQIIGLEIIGNLSESGYLGCETQLIATRLNVPLEDVERVLKRIQRYDPPGIGARDLRECLLVQAELSEKPDSLVLKVLREHFDDFINKRYEALARALKISLEEVKVIFQEISRFNPRPGEGAVSEMKQNYVGPDLIVERYGDDFIVTLNDGNLPNLRISRYYIDLVRGKKKEVDKSVREFVARKLESANWFINAIQQRRQTMLKVMRAIVNRQIEFFRHGRDFLKPMILRDIAEDVELDISVISRVTNGKYVQTEWGSFELKYFFSEKITSASGEDVSTKVIKEKLRRFIEQEDKRKPLSDQKLADLLKAEGFTVARRTVQKYREQMQIPIKKLRREI